MTDLRDVLRHIGGPYAVTRWSLVVSVVVSELAFFGGGLTPLRVVPGVLVLVLLTQLLALVPLAVARRAGWCGSLARPRPVLMLALFALVGVIRGVTHNVFVDALGVPNHLGLGLRLVVSVSVMVLALASMAVVIGANRDYSARMAALTDVNDAMTQAQARIVETVDDEQAAAVGRLAVRLQAELDTLDADHPAESATTLHALASDLVRPLSHQLARDVPTWEPARQPAAVPHSRARAALRLLPRGEPFLALATAFAVTVVAIGPYVALLGAPAALLQLVMLFAGSLVALVVLNMLLGALPRGLPQWAHWLAFVAAVVAYASYPFALTATIFHGRAIAGVIVFGAAGVAVSVAVTFAVVKAYWQVLQDGQDALAAQNAALLWSVCRARQVQWHQQRVFSRVLHGQVQSTIVAAEMRMDLAVRAHEPVAPILDGVRAELRDILAGIDWERANTGTLRRTTDKIAELWSGLCDVDIVVEPAAEVALAADDVCRTTVADLLTEASSNAIRHGRATWLRMRVGVDGDLARLRIEDDGAAPGDVAERGIGLRLLNECSTRWTREVTDEGNVLTADVPLVAAGWGEAAERT